MSLTSMIKQSCGGADNTSSKRIIMYIFTAVSCLMILFQAVFTAVTIYKWAMDKPDAVFMVHSVFPDIIWYCVFGIIGGIAGVNGFGKQAAKDKDTPDAEIN
jgi:H+/Cl- antiporter ClcA